MGFAISTADHHSEERQPVKESDVMIEQIQQRLCGYIMKTDTLMTIIKVVDAMKEDESCVESFCDLLNEMLFHWEYQVYEKKKGFTNSFL